MSFKGFKKTHEDDNYATFSHESGSKLVIPKKRLSPEKLKQLKEIKLHAADGVDTAADGRQSLPKTNEYQALADYQKQQEAAPPVQARQPDASPVAAQPYKETAPPVGPVSDPTDVGLPGANLEGAQPSDLSPNIQGPDSAPTTSDAAPNRAPIDPKQVSLEHQQNQDIEDKKFANDLVNQHITPKTYSSFFENKDTLGKIGSLFGMLLSGAGSGLTHQPNVLMTMMDNEIKRDYDAQVQSKANAQNFIKMNMENELNKANIQKLLAAGQVDQAQANSLMADVRLKAQQGALNQMGMVAVDHLQNMVNGMAPATKPLGQQMVNSVAAQEAAARQQRNVQHGNAIAANQQQYESTVNQMRVMGALPGMERFGNLAKEFGSMEVPGVGVAPNPVRPETVDRVKKIDEFMNNLSEYHRLGEKMGWRQNLNILTPDEKLSIPRLRNDLVTGYNDVKGLNRLTGEEIGKYEDIVPNLNKTDMTGAQKRAIGNLMNSVVRVRGQELKSAGIRPYAGQEPQQAQPKMKFSQGKWWTKGADGNAVEVKK